MTENDRDIEHAEPGVEAGTDAQQPDADETVPQTPLAPLTGLTPLIGLTPLGDASSGAGGGVCGADGCSL